MDQVFQNSLLVLAIFQKVVVEQVKNVVSLPVDVVDILHSSVPFLRLVVVPTDACVDCSNLRVFILENTHSIASVEVLGHLQLTKVEVAARHLLVDENLALAVASAQTVLEAQLPDVQGIFVELFAHFAVSYHLQRLESHFGELLSVCAHVHDEVADFKDLFVLLPVQLNRSNQLVEHHGVGQLERVLGERDHFIQQVDSLLIVLFLRFERFLRRLD